MRKAIKRNQTPPVTLRLYVLGIFFCAGLLFGYLSCRFTGKESWQQISDYVRQYVSFCQSDKASLPFLSTVASYGKYPLAALVLGLCSLRSVLLPLLCLFEGFGLSFAICSFSASLGAEGILMALMLLGFRAFLTVPCTLYVSALAMGGSWQGKGYIQLGSCGGILLLGAILESVLLPGLFLKIFA